jgi:hypothetical protein
MPPPAPQRRPVDVTSLEERAAQMKLKLRTGVVLPEAKKKTVALPRESFVPLLQADVGSPVSVSAYRYRLLVPVAQIIRESAQSVRRVTVATEADIYTIRNTLIRHFGGVTVLHQPPTPAFGVGARDPSDVAGTLEQNEHVSFEVYAAPVQEADDYFRGLRQELQEALQEGVILIECQHVTLIRAPGRLAHLHTSGGGPLAGVRADGLSRPAEC